MEWINVKENGLPKPDGNTEYLVLSEYGYGIGMYMNETESYYDPSNDYHYKNRILETCKWYLDFDSVGYEDAVTHYMKIEDPENE